MTSGKDIYVVDPTVSTGTFNRWMAQLGKPIVGLHNPGEIDAKMLAYTSEPLGADLQIAGHHEVVRVLVARGARLDLKDKLWLATPLGWARHGERKTIADYLAGQGGLA